MSDPVTISTVGDVAVISVDDGKANAISFAVLDGLNAALDAAEGSAKAIAIIGREGKFSAGFDLSVMTTSVDGARKLLTSGAELALRMFENPLPVVLGVTGHALAMGGILLTCADYRVGAEGSFKIGLNEVAIGMPVPSFAVELCRDRLRKRWFTRCVQHAEILGPLDALDAGFLDEVVAPGEVQSRSVEVAQHLADTVHPGPFRMTRENIRGALVAELHAKLTADMQRFDVSS